MPWLRRRSVSCGALRLEPRDQADDLAGADVERGDDRRAARRHRLHLRGEAVMEAHAAPPFFFGLLALSASTRAAAASSDNRTVTRSGSRRSIAAMSRLRILLSRSSLTSVSSACSSLGFRQANVDAVLEHDVPAPLGDQDGGVELDRGSRDTCRAAPGSPWPGSRRRRPRPAAAWRNAGPHRARPRCRRRRSPRPCRRAARARRRRAR